MKYRAEIDGLRGICVLAVVGFHAGFRPLAGGFVGVDVFFVISGYLITSMILGDLLSNSFTLLRFYMRRAARLTPSLIFTLLIVFLFGFMFYDNGAFASLGKDIAFSSIGAANLLFAQGVNYFASEAKVRPLLHLWSLGIEEQFYLVWPVILKLTASLNKKHRLLFVLILFLVSLIASSLMMVNSSLKAYYLPQYRVFELLVGALVAIFLRDNDYLKTLPLKVRSFLAAVGLLLIIIPLFIFDDQTLFPGYSALVPCLGTALLLLFAVDTPLSKLLQSKMLVFIGLISYPLYLLHFPVISILDYFQYDCGPVYKVLIVLAIAIPLSWVLYQYFETPVRKIAKEQNQSSASRIGLLAAGMLVLAAAGFSITIMASYGVRYKLFNPYAAEIASTQKFDFYNKFQNGYNVKDSVSSILFVGDSEVQQYVIPIINSLGINESEVDTVTQGGCVLLKGVDFNYSDNSCDDLRELLYSLEKDYEAVIISQHWNVYNTMITNIQGEATNPANALEDLSPFITETIEHFNKISEKIIIIGGHITVSEEDITSPTLFTNQQIHAANLARLHIINFDYLSDSRSFFDTNYGWLPDTYILHPQDIFCLEGNQGCVLHDSRLSFFKDDTHLSSAGKPFTVDRLITIFNEMNFYTKQ